MIFTEYLPCGRHHCILGRQKTYLQNITINILAVVITKLLSYWKITWLSSIVIWKYMVKIIQQEHLLALPRNTKQCFIWPMWLVTCISFFKQHVKHFRIGSSTASSFVQLVYLACGSNDSICILQTIKMIRLTWPLPAPIFTPSLTDGKIQQLQCFLISEGLLACLHSSFLCAAFYLKPTFSRWFAKMPPRLKLYVAPVSVPMGNRAHAPDGAVQH